MKAKKLKESQYKHFFLDSYMTKYNQICINPHEYSCRCVLDRHNSIIDELYNLNIIGRKYRIKGMI